MTDVQHILLYMLWVWNDLENIIPDPEKTNSTHCSNASQQNILISYFIAMSYYATATPHFEQEDEKDTCHFCVNKQKSRMAITEVKVHKT